MNEIQHMQEQIRQLERKIEQLVNNAGFRRDPGLNVLGQDTYIAGTITGSQAVGARVISAVTQNVNSATWTALSFDTEISNLNTVWDAGAPTRFTAPADGYYMAGGSYEKQVSFAAAESRLIIAVRKNGVDYYGANEDQTIGGKVATVGVTTGMIWMDAGDYLEIMAYQDEGVTNTIYAATTQYQNRCCGWMARIA